MNARERLQVVTKGSLTMALDAAAADKIAAMAEQRLENPVPGDVMHSNDNAVSYRIEHHASGGKTLHRQQPKLSKAEKKAAKRARRR